MTRSEKLSYWFAASVPALPLSSNHATNKLPLLVQFKSMEALRRKLPVVAEVVFKEETFVQLFASPVTLK